jgi:hypothetical protein
VLAQAVLILVPLTLAAAPAGGADADDGVVVIRGANVSVARPLTPERVRDGSAEVEIVRVEIPPAPAAPPRPAAPEREVVVVYLPAEEPAWPVGIPVAWPAAWPWAGKPAFHPPRWHAGPRRHVPFATGFHLPHAHGGPRHGHFAAGFRPPGSHAGHFRAGHGAAPRGARPGPR